MTDFNKSFEEIVTPSKSKESLKQFSNWIIGISFAICSFLITESSNFIGKECHSNKTVYIIILILSMLGAFISGLNKYFILNRDTKLSVKQDILKRITIDLQLKKIDVDSAIKEWDKHMGDWTSAFVSIQKIGIILNISLVLTAASILLSGLYILLTI
jgi:hypothetical protein